MFSKNANKKNRMNQELDRLEIIDNVKKELVHVSRTGTIDEIEALHKHLNTLYKNSGFDNVLVVINRINYKRAA